MGYERYPRGTDPQGDYYGRSETQDYGRDYGSGRYGSYSSARDYRSAGALDRDRDEDRRGYGQRDGYGQRESYGQRDFYGRDRDDDRGGYRAQRDDLYRDRDGGRQDNYGAQRYGRSAGGYGGQSYGQSRYGRGGEYHGSYASDGRRFNDVGGHRHDDDDDRRAHGRHRDRGASYGRQPQGYDYDERGFLARAGDEVRSWFGDEDAERRREADSRYDERYYAQQGHTDRDSDYHSWRSGQIAALDRDYDEYRQENRSRFENEFSSWRTSRQNQRQSLGQVKEHDEVVGSDGSHVGTVDKVRGDRILLTKNDADAGGQHHSIPSRWIQSVEDKKVTLSKTADEAKQHWRNEEQNQAMFGYGDRGDQSGQNRGTYGQSGLGTTTGSSTSTATGGTTGATSGTDKDTNLNRSFSGTY
ncbi:DUF2171 domain-containing protein [Sphingomonas endophytica]|uniref:SWFGD domain-containing protein n=1 Tax=Sphingomonas endophytica TaxID=869719 RepID=A0A147I6Y5_9SPHN|nr:DUF2171 domain-containing protein [Sphingomonas endophytica]KTT74597.1 hypothetical protein NS334_04170 [Sphingomonas endophytica]